MGRNVGWNNKFSHCRSSYRNVLYRLVFLKDYGDIVRLTIWHQLLLEYWFVDTWCFAHPRDQRTVTRLENVLQLNIRRGKKLGFQLSHRQPPEDFHKIILDLEPFSKVSGCRRKLYFKVYRQCCFARKFTKFSEQLSSKHLSL